MPSSYEQLADKIIRDFIKAVVLIDDHWQDSYPSSSITAIDEKNVDLSIRTAPLAGEIDVPTEDLGVSADTASSIASQGQIPSPDSYYLHEIGQEVVGQGFLFTGFGYREELKDTAYRLARHADILILDWNLGANDSRPTLDLLSKLKKSGSPRFVFILTDQIDPQGIRDQVGKQLDCEPEGDDQTFACGSFFFSLKNKPIAGGDNTVQADDLLAEAITGIAQRFCGLLQLAVLEVLSSYRNSVHAILSHFGNDLDVPLLGEWLEQKSPVRNASFLASLIADEWQSLASRGYCESPALSGQHVAPYLQQLGGRKNTSKLKDVLMSNLISDKSKEKMPEDITNLVLNLQNWLDAGGPSWPEELPSRKNKPWNRQEVRLLALAFACAKRDRQSGLFDRLVNLDTLFHSHQVLPDRIVQGSVFQVGAEAKRLVCITPLCDCDSPDRVNNCFTFMGAEIVSSDQLTSEKESAVVIVRDSQGHSTILKVNPNLVISLRVEQPVLENGKTTGICPLIAQDDGRQLTIIGHLRQPRVQALISLAAGNAISVGLDRSEIIRQLCKSN